MLLKDEQKLIMNDSRKNYLLKNTFIFTIGNLGSKLITFFLVPLYTNMLSTKEYGVADLITTVCSVLAPILILNISESLMRFNLDKGVNKEKITKIAIRIFEISIVIGALLIPVYELFDTLREYSVYIFLYNVSIGASTVFLYDLRGKELLVEYSIGSIILTFSSAILNIVFLVNLKMGVKGYILSFIIANFVTAIYAAIVGKAFLNYRRTKFDRKKMYEMVKFSSLLIPNTFMWWIMNSSDRVMVSSMVGNAANGIYAISYKLPTLISTLTGIFNQAWGYSAIKEEGAKDENEYNNAIFRKLISIAMLMGIGMLTVIKPFLYFYVEKSYYIAWEYTPFLIIGCVYLTMGTFMSSTYNVHKDSLGFVLSASVGAFSNIVLNFVFIPRFKVYGAALATCISYIIVFIFRYFHTRKYIKFDIKNKEFIVGSILLLSSSFFIYLDNLFGITFQIIILIVSLITYSDIFKLLVEWVEKSIKRK